MQSSYTVMLSLIQPNALSNRCYTRSQAPAIVHLSLLPGLILDVLKRLDVPRVEYGTSSLFSSFKAHFNVRLTDLYRIADQGMQGGGYAVNTVRRSP